MVPNATPYEDLLRLPFLVRWPGHVPAGTVCSEITSTIDLLPTLARLAGTKPPGDRTIDGRDLDRVWTGGADSPHDELFYFPVLSSEPDAVRDDRFKLLGETGVPGRNRPHLTRLDADAEAHDLRMKHPEDASRLGERLASMREEIRENPRGWRSPER